MTTTTLAPDEPIAQATTNSRSGSQVDVPLDQGAALFYRPQTNEFWFVPPESTHEFETECKNFGKLIFDFRAAKEHQLQMADELLQVQRTLLNPSAKFNLPPRAIESATAKLEAAEKAVETQQKKLEAEIKPLGELDATGDKIMELIPIAQRRTAAGGGTTAGLNRDPKQFAWNKKWTYVRADKVKSHFRGYKLSPREKVDAAGKPVNTVVENGKINTKKLGEQLRAFEATGKLAEWKKTGLLWEHGNAVISESLNSWAQGINQGNSHFEIKPEVQLLRYFAGAGLQSEWKPFEGKVALRGNVRGEFMLAEGKFTAACYFPTRAGFMWELTGPKSGKVHKIGLMRFGARLELFGLVGASAVAELDVTVEYRDAVKGLAGMRGAKRTEPLKSQVLDVSKKARDGASVNAGGDLFVGARAGGSVLGAIEWNSPESKEFEDLAKVGPLLAGQLGAGIGGHVTVTYAQGKFRFQISAEACLGAGARGKLELEVDVGKVFEFFKYLSHALYATGYEFMVIIEKAAFEAWRDLSFWVIKTGGEVEAEVRQVGNNLIRNINQLIDQLEREADRVWLMDKVLKRPRVLDFAPPETKGMILYQLTRHSWMSNTVFASENQGLNVDTMKRRKDAVMIVCRKARSKREFENMMQHMSKRGAKVAEPWTASFDHVKRFMNMGVDTADMDSQVQSYYQSLATEFSPLDTMYASLYDEPVVGYAFVDNDHPAYAMNGIRGSDERYFAMGGFDPGPVEPVGLA
jgi:hypothetical protein